MKLAVVTIVKDRTRHLRAHLAGLRRSHLRPDQHVVVTMGDADVEMVVQEEQSSAVVVELEYRHGPLPLAHARNVGAARALALGAEALVFLDVDCIASPQLLGKYRDAIMTTHAEPILWCGPVTYLPAPVDGFAALDMLALLRNPHRARPDPKDGQLANEENYDLFWSLSFAVSVPTWRSLPGFCEEYIGYGGEDTDFACAAHDRGVGLRWIGGADAYHQFHPVSDPPIEHLHDILANAYVFYRRWGRWPMEGWLRSFEKMNLLDFDRSSGRWVRSRR
ncbi:glycosyltransferase family 2 protein [Rhodococcus sp. T9N]|jgi:GT2 family glycosyltransferase|uniref:glycosyltransferase family 2 protein n=1 Tax=Rhodococcus sp. T9N TaxID=627445 RepID=UPI0021C406CC|nr:hypothetical protein [Rhodococcus sp. T9N]